MSPVDIRRAETRPHTKIDWLDSRHSFSFGRHYDPANTHHGLLLVSNDDRVAPASGFPPHFHRDTEVVAPGYEQRDVNRELEKGGLRAIASGQGHEGAISIHQRDAVLWGARLQPGETTTVPDGAHVHLFVAAGTVDVEDAGALAEGDAGPPTSARPPPPTPRPRGPGGPGWGTP